MDKICLGLKYLKTEIVILQLEQKYQPVCWLLADSPSPHTCGWLTGLILSFDRCRQWELESGSY